MATVSDKINLPVEENKANPGTHLENVESPRIYGIPKSVEELGDTLTGLFERWTGMKLPLKEPKTLIDDWEKAVSKLTDAPRISIRAAGYFLVSSLVASKVRITNRRGPKRSPNLYVVVFGSPSRTRKSTVRSYVKDTLMKIMGEEAFSEREVTVSSPEGLADAAVDVQERVERGDDKWGRVVFIMPDEFSDFMTDMMKKDYEKGTLYLHKVLKDGGGYNFRLSKRNRYYRERLIKPGTYATLLGYGQWEDGKSVFTMEHISRGYMRRLVTIKLRNEDQTLPYPPAYVTTPAIERSNQFLMDVQREMKNLADLIVKFDVVEAKIFWGEPPKYDTADKELIECSKTYAGFWDNHVFEYFVDLEKLDPPERYLTEEYHNLIDLATIEALADPDSIKELEKQVELWKKGDLTEIEKYFKEYGLNETEIENILKRAREGKKIGVVKVRAVHVGKALPFFLRMLRDKRDIIAETLDTRKELDLPSYEKYKMRLISVFNKYAERYVDENGRVLGRSMPLSKMLNRAGLVDVEDRNTINAIRNLLSDGRIFIVRVPGRGRGGSSQTVFDTRKAAEHFYKRKIEEEKAKMKKKGHSEEKINETLGDWHAVGIIALYDNSNALEYNYRIIEYNYRVKVP